MIPLKPVVGGYTRARGLARELGLPIVSQVEGEGLAIQVGGDSLHVLGRTPDEPPGPYRPVRWQLHTLDTLSAAGRRRGQPLLKAVLGRKKTRGRIVLDATAGAGEDAWILAACGCSVIAVEQEAVIFALLRDALSRAGPSALPTARRIRLLNARAQDVLDRFGDRADANGLLLPRPHVVYMDPFFQTERRRKSAVKRPMRILQALAAGQEGFDPQEILPRALAVSRERVVVKRPKTARPWSSAQGGPDRQIQGRGFRFDVYMVTVQTRKRQSGS